MKFNSKLFVTLMVTMMLSPVVSAMTEQEKLDDINKMLKGNSAIIDSLHESLAMYIVQQKNSTKHW